MVLVQMLSNAVTAISDKATELSLFLEETMPYYDVLREYKYLVITVSIAGIGLVKYLWRPRNIPPGPWGLPFIGSLREISNLTHFDYMRMKEKYGDIFSYYIGKDLHVVLNTDELIREALVKRGDEFSSRPIEDIGGITDEIFSCKFSENFKNVKRLSMQALKSHVLDSAKFEESVARNAGYVIEYMEKQNGKPFNIRDILVKATSNVIYNLVFNDHFDFDNPKLQDFIDRSHEYNAATFSDEIAWTFYAKYIIPEFIRNIVFKKAEETQMERVDYFIELTLDQYKEHQKSIDPNRPRDYVDSIMLARSDADLREMAKSTAVFIPDATDSIADLARCCLYHCCKYPEEMAKMQKVIDEACGTKPPTLRMRGQLVYVEAFIWEVLRITCFCPVLQPHAPIQDTTLGGYNIPEGCYVWCNLFPTYKDPKVFPEPEKFKPSRFIDASGKLASTGLSYPFGMGRRGCMGKELVRAEVLVLLASFVQRMNFKFADEDVEPIHYIGPFLATTPLFKMTASDR